MSRDLTRRLSGWNVALAVYALAAVAGLAGILLRPGTVGHHWDWLIPSDPVELRHFAWTSGFAWQDFAYGSYVTYRYATTLTSFLFGAPGFVGLGGAFVSKALLVGSVFACGAGMRFLLLTLVQDEPDERDGVLATLAGLLYALAPFAYNQMIAGDQSALISNAASPFAIALALYAVRANGRMWIAYGLGSALLLMLAVASAQVFVFTIGIAWFASLALRWEARTALRLGALSAVAVVLCAFWILPALFAGGAVHTVVQTASPDRAFATYQQFANPLFTLTAIGFPGDFYLHALGSSGGASLGAVLFFAACGVLAAVWIAALVKHRTPLLIGLSAIFLVFALLPLGGNPILGPIILTVFKALLPYSLFLRTPQHLMFVVTLLLPVLAFLSGRVLSPTTFKASAVAGLAIAVLYGQGFLIHSNFFGLIGPFVQSPGESATDALAAEPVNQDYRTLFVPNAGSYYFHPGIFSYYFEGADEPQVRFLPGTTLAAGSKWSPYDGAQTLTKALDELVPDGGAPAMQRLLLQLGGIRYLVAHDVGTPSAGVRLASEHGRPYLEGALHRGGVTTLTQTLPDRTIWRFGDPVTRVYAPDCVFGVPAQADPYDVLALAGAAASCRRPAMVVTPGAGRSEEVYSAATFSSDTRSGLGLTMPQANVPVTLSAAHDGFIASVPPGAQDVEGMPLRVRAGATGIAMRMYSSDSRRVWIQLYAPDAANYYETNVDFSGKVQDVALNFNRFGKVGNPRVPAIRTLRFASTNGGLRQLQMYVGGVHWISAARDSTDTPNLAIAVNRWDQYYFGGDRPHVLFEARPGLAPVYVHAPIARSGDYDLFAHVQEYRFPISLRAAIDGKWGACSPASAPADVSERLVPLGRVHVDAGTHVLGIRFCTAPPQPKLQDVGVQSLIVAAAGFAAPARRTPGMVAIAQRSAGGFRLDGRTKLVVFTDAFDPRWTAVAGGVTLTHVTVNGYANGWIVPDGTAGPIALSFAPQRQFTAGMIVTFVAILLASIAIVAIVLLERRRTSAPNFVAASDAT